MYRWLFKLIELTWLIKFIGLNSLEAGRRWNSDFGMRNLERREATEFGLQSLRAAGSKSWAPARSGTILRFGEKRPLRDAENLTK